MQEKQNSQKNSLFTRVLIFSSLLLVIGISLIVYSYHKDCNKVLQRGFDAFDIIAAKRGRPTTVYLVKKVNTSCQSCLDYERIKNNPGIHILFYVTEDYGDIDIENFIDAFGILAKHPVQRMDKKWREMFDTCNPREIQNNMVIDLDKAGKITRIRKF